MRPATSTHDATPACVIAYTVSSTQPVYANMRHILPTGGRGTGLCHTYASYCPSLLHSMSYFMHQV